MTERCARDFDEALLSAYLDRELTQAASQRVRVHLEDCGHCRRIVNEMQTLRETTMSTRFPTVEDREWDERPRGALSRVLRWAGWGLILVWLAAVAFLGVRELIQDPATRWHEVALVFALFGGTALLLLSILLDRLASRGSDRYRRIEK